MKANQYFILFFILLFVYSVQAQVPTPGQEQSEKILILNGVAHLGNGELIDNSVIAFENGVLTVVGHALLTRVDQSKYDRVIDADGKHIYPGFIAPNSILGLVEIGQVRASHDYDDTGELLPHVRAGISYNTDSKIIPTVRANGVLVGQITPRGGIISGTSSIMQLDAWNWEDAVIKMDDGIHLHWPKQFQRKGWWAEPGDIKKEKGKETANKIQKIKDFVGDAKAYCSTSEHEQKNLRFEAMRGVFDGSKTLYIHANFVRELLQVVNFVREYEIEKAAIVGGYDSWMITDQLKDNNISIVLRRLHKLPMRYEDDIDMPYKIPSLLHKAGVLYCLDYSGDMEAMGTRNLPFLAGTAAAYGLSKEEALMAITSNAAKILGIDHLVGTLSSGLQATFFISEGDALDMRTNNVTMAFVGGRQIDLDNHQKQLYEKFKAKYQD